MVTTCSGMVTLGSITTKLSGSLPFVFSKSAVRKISSVRTPRNFKSSVKGFILFANYDGEKRSVDQVKVLQVDEILHGETPIQFVDVRRPSEHANGHAPRTINLPLNRLADEFEKLDPSLPTYVICEGGYRSSLATSILENAGFNDLHNVTGGTRAWIEAGLETGTSATACANS